MSSAPLTLPSRNGVQLERDNGEFLPHSREAEQALLGCLLIDSSAWDVVNDVRPDDFHRPDHQELFAAMLELRADGSVPDTVTLIAHLQRTDRLDKAGGIAYLGKLARETPTAQNIRNWADVVVERARLRRLICLSHDVAQAVTDGASSLDIAQGLRPVLDSFVESARPTSVEILAFTATDILGPIQPERFLLPAVPADAYTLLAGALASFKSTFLMYLLIWKATGWDILNLDPQGYGIEIGKSVLLTYEDTDGRILAKLQRIIQHVRESILRLQGTQEADRFIERAVANIRRISLAGQIGMGILRRFNTNILPNESFLESFFAKVREFAPAGALIGVDPLRLAIVGSQNDDDGADIAVHTLNRMATAVPGSGLIVASHTTKNGAQEVGAGYAAASYATSGSALYSQHARSNFHMARLKDSEIRELFDPAEVTPAEADKQLVAKLTHGRLSHGLEQGDRYLLMKAGVLVPVQPQTSQGPADMVRVVAVPIIAAIDRIKQSGVRASPAALENDGTLVQAVGTIRKIRTGIKLLTENNYLEATGSTSSRDLAVTVTGRRFLGVESCRESTPERDS